MRFMWLIRGVGIFQLAFVAVSEIAGGSAELISGMANLWLMLASASCAERSETAATTSPDTTSVYL